MTDFWDLRVLCKFPGIKKGVREKEKTEDESREQKIKACGPERVGGKKKNVVSGDEFEASGKGVSLKGEAFNL